MGGIATLIGKTYTLDSIGNSIATETSTTIFVDEKSITRQEWSEAGRQGLNPAVLLVTPSINYSGQDTVEYNSQRYAVYRTYEVGEDVELYLELKGGV